MENELVILLSKLQAIAQTGQEYGASTYDLERYQELEQLTGQLILLLAPDIPMERLTLYLSADDGYATPKVDVRAVIFDEQNKLLFVKEKSDGKWALPGGWADIGYSPKEIAEKETMEEAGIKVRGERLIALRDKAKHPYPPSLIYTYKLFIACTFCTGSLKAGVETSAAQFFSRSELERLPLSEERNILADIILLFEDHYSENNHVICD